MSIVAEFVIPTEVVPGGKTLTDLPAATIRLERIIPSDAAVHPIFWVVGVESDRFLDQLQNEAGITDVEELVELDEAVLFRATWTPEVPVIEGIETLRATILNAEGTADEWVFQVIAEERQHLQEFQQIFAEQGIPVELKRISRFSSEEDGDPRLTPEQRQTLTAAYEMGYYDQPKRVTQAQLGDQFEITGRAVSKRLRRGTKHLIETSLIDPTDQA